MSLNTFSYLLNQYQVVAVDDYDQIPYRIYIALLGNQVTELTKVICIDLDRQVVFAPQMIGSYAKFLCPVRLIDTKRDNIEEIKKRIEKLPELTKRNLSRIIEEKPEISSEDIEQLNILGSTILRYIDPTLKDLTHRYKSWEHCYCAFGNINESTDILALHLGFYLASWGMYRGSSGLLRKDYKVHSEAVAIIKKHHHLRYEFIDLPRKEDVMNVFTELSECYSKLDYYNGKDKKFISATDTLISKVILGSLGCLPAFDRYFNLGLFDKEYSVINGKSIDIIWAKTNEMKSEIELVQGWIRHQTGTLYPPMKIIDMYYWQQGFDKEPIKK